MRIVSSTPPVPVCTCEGSPRWAYEQAILAQLVVQPNKQTNDQQS